MLAVELQFECSSFYLGGLMSIFLIFTKASLSLVCTIVSFLRLPALLVSSLHVVHVGCHSIGIIASIYLELTSAFSV